MFAVWAVWEGWRSERRNTKEDSHGLGSDLGGHLPGTPLG
jgi:hypothetical protein